jgi:hypothetical protein
MNCRDTRCFSGATLFGLKATHGLPLGFALDRIINTAGVAVEWPSFIEAARKNGWWDYQTYEVLCHGLEDGDIPKDVQAGIRSGFQRYVLAHPHPSMEGENNA